MNRGNDETNIKIGHKNRELKPKKPVRADIMVERKYNDEN